MKRVLAAVVTVMAMAVPAYAHVSVTPREANRGSVATLTFRVPNERDDATTTKVEIDLGGAPSLTDVTPADVPGWTATVAEGRVAWTAAAPDAAIAGEAAREFTVTLGPLPSEGDTVTFAALQTYSDGEVVRWIGGTDHPAPVVRLTGAAPPTTTTSTPTTTTSTPTTTSTATTTTVPPSTVAPDDDDDEGSAAPAALLVGAGVVALLAAGIFRLTRGRT